MPVRDNPPGLDEPPSVICVLSVRGTIVTVPVLAFNEPGIETASAVMLIPEQVTALAIVTEGAVSEIEFALMPVGKLMLRAEASVNPEPETILDPDVVILPPVEIDINGA